MINVTHDSHYRRPWLQFSLNLFLEMCFDFFFHALFFFEMDIVAHFLDQQCRSILIQHLVDGHHHAHFHQFLDNLGSFY